MCNERNVISVWLGAASAGLFLVALFLLWHASDDTPLIVDEPNQFVGTVLAKEELELQVMMRNRGRHVVRIVGCNGRCSLHGCFYATNMPMEIGAGESKVINVSFRATDEAGEFVYPLTFYTDAPYQAEVTVNFTGIVAKGTKRASAVTE